MLQFTGTLKVKKDEVVISDKFKKREFVVSDDHDQYEQLICFQLAQDKTSLIDNVEIGSQITVNFNLRGREWTNKDGVVMHFNTLDAWKIDSGAQAPAPTTSASPAATAAANTTDLDSEDLPF